MARFHPQADRAGFEPCMFARYVSKFDANRARMSGQIRRRLPKETAQNRREVGLGSKHISGAPSFSPYRSENEDDDEDENEAIVRLPARIPAVDNQVAASEIAAGI